MMIATPKKRRPRHLASARERLVAAARARRAAGPARARARAKRRRMFSTITTAPSTMMPKSIAPRLSRLALILPSTMPVTANSIESGMTSATISAAREVAEQQEEHGDHQRGALEQVRSHRLERRLDQLGPVVDRPWPRTPGGRLGSTSVEPRGDALGDGAAVLADQHERRAEHDLLAVLGGGAAAQLAAEPDGGDVAHADRHAVARRDHDLADVRRRLEPPGRVHQVLLALVRDEAAARAAVVALERQRAVVEREAVGDEPRGSGVTWYCFS